MKNFTYWFRWIAVLPGAMIAGFLATFPLHWILYLVFAQDGTLLGFIELPPGSNIPIERTLTPFVIAITYLLVGFEIAPENKFKTSVVLAVLYLATFIGLIVFLSHQYPLEMRGFLAPIGLLLGLYIVWKKSSKIVDVK